MIKKDDGKVMTSVKVGTKGQIVIPKEIRDMFKIEPGEFIMIMADPNQGMLMHRLDFFTKMAEDVFAGNNTGKTSKEIEELEDFAKDIQSMEGEDV